MQNIVFGGLLLTASSANGVIAWAMELSFFFHTYEILMVNGECQKKAAVFPQSTSIYLSISCIDIIYLHWLLFFLRLTNTVIVCLSVCLSAEFHGYDHLEFNPSHSSMGGQSALISGDTWLDNVGMDISSSPNMLIRDVWILTAACLLFWVGGYVSFRVQRYVR
jgi:hypothetical protein